MRIVTATGDRPWTADSDLAAAFEALQRDPEDFLRLDRSSGESLQTLAVPIERVRDGRVYRPVALPAVQAMFAAFAAGAADWDAGVRWVDVTDELRAARREPWVFAAVVAGALAAAIAVGWWFLRKVL
jgi:hypothetical protein